MIEHTLLSDSPQFSTHLKLNISNLTLIPLVENQSPSSVRILTMAQMVFLHFFSLLFCFILGPQLRPPFACSHSTETCSTRVPLTLIPFQSSLALGHYFFIIQSKLFHQSCLQSSFRVELFEYPSFTPVLSLTSLEINQDTTLYKKPLCFIKDKVQPSSHQVGIFGKEDDQRGSQSLLCSNSQPKGNKEAKQKKEEEVILETSLKPQEWLGKIFKEFMNSFKTSIQRQGRAYWKIKNRAILDFTDYEINIFFLTIIPYSSNLFKKLRIKKNVLVKSHRILLKQKLHQHCIFCINPVSEILGWSGKEKTSTKDNAKDSERKGKHERSIPDETIYSTSKEMRKRGQEKEMETNGMRRTRNMEGGQRMFFKDELRTVGSTQPA
ncbi:hypothetical protein VP01_873g7 [Puccinia sorghi]|uniref:Uncharacterized protein n=1 Tax=Puccinia sorghi TaxID=27349 RepID=A0A0L6U8K8_9BASI|nr:hypothetical protein VP01_873g7 [Puccinia sorghi]